MAEQSLFSDTDRGQRNDAPLPVRMRPRTLDEVLGQDEVIGPGTWLRQAIEEDELVPIVLYGPAGTGKTYLSIALAVKALKEKTAKKIILSRPAVEAGEKLGFLPGDMKDKIDPYLQPLYDALEDMLPQARLQDMMDKHQIQIAPLAFMRGRTLSDAVVILDEAQNTTPDQMKMFLTRLGFSSKFVVTGDVTQRDLLGVNGLDVARRVLEGLDDIAFVDLDRNDIVRHALVARIVDAYEDDEARMGRR